MTLVGHRFLPSSIHKGGVATLEGVRFRQRVRFVQRNGGGSDFGGASIHTKFDSYRGGSSDFGGTSIPTELDS